MLHAYIIIAVGQTIDISMKFSSFEMVKCLSEDKNAQQSILIPVVIILKLQKKPNRLFILLNTLQRYQCVCMPGWEGTFCENESNECNSEPCKNNGTCMDLFNSYR